MSKSGLLAPFTKVVFQERLLSVNHVLADDPQHKKDSVAGRVMTVNEWFPKKSLG